ncbi:MAG: fructosamine kinase family protein [Maribacter sp.]
METSIKKHIEYLLCIRIRKIQGLSGGDLSRAYLLETDMERFFCKVNDHADAFDMFQAEKSGLDAIAKTHTIATPKVLLCEKLEQGGLLVMEYIEPKRSGSKDMELLGHQLAALHRFSGASTFGWKTDNYIGSLPQSNHMHSSWPQFYAHERLLPQFKMAYQQQLLSFNEVPTETTLLDMCEKCLPITKPSLLHGDLWSGNYLIASDNTPYLIDPAVYFGHFEVDLAMTRLFGGFDSSFYLAYSEHFPKVGGEKARNDLYQLYYLLVHLNLFGKSYYPQVKSIIGAYF